MPAFDAMPLPTAPNPAVGAGSTPEAELPRYDILTPEQLNQGGKIVFRGQTIEILAPNDPRISPELQAAYPTDTVWYGLFEGGDSASARMISITSGSAINFLAPLATISERRWDGIIEVGKVVPNSFFAGENVILANNDPRIPANLRDIDLGGFYYWAIDARSLNPSLPNNLFRPILYSRFVEYPFDSNNVSPSAPQRDPPLPSKPPRTRRQTLRRPAAPPATPFPNSSIVAWLIHRYRIAASSLECAN
jgi:hypothetical protein